MLRELLHERVSEGGPALAIDCEACHASLDAAVTIWSDTPATGVV